MRNIVQPEREGPQKGCNHMNIAGRLKEGRLAKGLTQKEVANIIGSNQQNITSYEKGRSHPPLDVLKTFIELYELDPYVLLELKPQPWNKIPVYNMRSEAKEFFIPKPAICCIAFKPSSGFLI